MLIGLSLREEDPWGQKSRVTGLNCSLSLHACTVGLLL